MASADDHTYQGTALARTEDDTATATVGRKGILAFSAIKHLLTKNLGFF
jgi:hypothetical protein